VFSIASTLYFILLKKTMPYLFDQCFSSNENLDLLDQIIGDDGYVEWHSLLKNITLPSGINFVDPENRFLAEEKIDLFFSKILKFFTIGNPHFSNEIVDDLLKRLCLGKVEFPGINNESVESFLNRTKQAIKQNEILLTFAMNLDDFDFSNYEPYIIDIVTYCYILEILCINLAKDEDLFQEILSAIDYEREKGNSKEWRKYASLFQKAKISSILPFIPDLSPKKVKESFTDKYVDDTYSPLSRIGLTINITEAVLEDLHQKNIENARAGYELAFMDGLLDFSKFSNKKRILVAHTSSMYRYSAIPRNWSDLYNAWNLIFVGNFEEFPYYACKLLFPEVSNYQDSPHRYLYPRLLGLWLHIHYVLYEAVHGHDRKHDLSLPKETLEKMGKITWTYAKAYRTFYDKLNYRFSPKWWIPIDYFNDKCQRIFFLILKKGMRSVNNFEYLWKKFLNMVNRE
jgi:hypothetical protein